MKPPRIIARGKYFYTGHYIKGRKNEVERSTRIPLDIQPMEDPNWWKKSKHRSKLQAILKDIEFEREAGVRGFGIEAPKNTPITIEELLSEFNAANAIERDRERTKATLVHRKNAVDFFKRFAGEWYALDRAGVLELRKKAKVTMAPASIRGYFTVLKMLFAYAVREEYVRTNPFDGVTVTVPKRLPGSVSIEDEKRLFEFLYHARKPLFDQVLFERLTGIRAQDICRLKWSMLENGLLTYHNAKAHRDEILPLSEASLSLLKHVARKGEYIFAYRNRRTVGYYLQRTATFGAPHITTHQMKRSYLQEVAKVEPDERTFQALAHHSAIANKIAVEHYSGRDVTLMLSALERAQKHWNGFLSKLFRTSRKLGHYVFANKKS